MDIKQIYTLVNNATAEATGRVDILNEDLSNVVTVGEEIFNARAYDRYVYALVNQIGKIIFVNRPYTGRVPSVFMDGWEYGSVLEKVSFEMPVAYENESWELNNGEVYEQDIFTKPVVSVKFFNQKTTFEVPLSVTELQVKMSFQNAEQLNGFISGLYTAVENSITIKLEELIRRTITNMIAETIYDDYGSAGLSTKSGIKAINLLKLYNDANSTTLTFEQAMRNTDFIRFCAYTMKVYVERVQSMTTLFNVGGKDRHTPSDRLHWVLLSDFKASADVYLQSVTFHNDFVKLPNAEVVDFWQGTGTDYSVTNVSKIDVKLASDNTKTVSTTGIIGCLFDTFALGVCNKDRRITSHYNAKAEFTNLWYKQDAMYFNDLNENMIVFFAA